MSNFFSERLHALRGTRNKAAFAKELGIPPPMYHRYEAGQIPHEKNLRVIAEHCGVTIDYLLGRTDDPSPMSHSSHSPPIIHREPAAGYGPPDVCPSAAQRYAGLVRELAPMIAHGRNVAACSQILRTALDELIRYGQSVADAKEGPKA